MVNTNSATVWVKKNKEAFINFLSAFFLNYQLKTHRLCYVLTLFQKQ